MQRNTLEAAAYWGIPPVIALVTYWPALHAWFQLDDFVWLNLVAHTSTWHDVWYALFEPTVHGTWRPLGERIYFLTLQSLFGYSSALSFRIVAFLGQFACMALLSAISFKLTRSRIAAWLAPLLWIINDKLVLTMVWNSNFNYVSCGFFMLTALWCLLRYTETNRGLYRTGMWAAFIVGLGALEIMIVFPVLATLYALTCARPFLKKVLPLFGVSAVFWTLHSILAPNRAGTMYKMYFDATIMYTFARYWKKALDPENLTVFTPLPASAGIAGAIIFTLALLGYAGYQAYRRNFVPLFFLGCFIILLAPFLPLREHVDASYLGLPLVGLAMLGASAFAHGWHGEVAWRTAGVTLLCFYAFPTALVAHRASWAWAHWSWSVRSMVMSVAEAHRLRPDGAILLKNVDDILFWHAISQRCFAFLGIDNVYLAPGSEQHITPHPELGSVDHFIIPAALLKQNLSRPLSIYDCKTGHVEHTTATESTPLSVEVAQSDLVDVADPRNADRLSSDWYPIEQHSRWMAKRALLWMRTSGRPGQKLRVSGYCPGAALKNGAVLLTISVDGASFPTVPISKPDAPFEFEFSLREGVPKQIEVAVEVNRTFRVAPDIRELGLAFGTFEIQ